MSDEVFGVPYWVSDGTEWKLASVSDPDPNPEITQQPDHYQLPILSVSDPMNVVESDEDDPELLRVIMQDLIQLPPNLRMRVEPLGGYHTPITVPSDSVPTHITVNSSYLRPVSSEFMLSRAAARTQDFY